MKNLGRWVVLGACTTALAAGCGKKAATCENAIDSLLRIEFYGHGRNPSVEERKMIEQMMPGERAKLIDWCRGRDLSSEDLQCVVDARTHEQWIVCGSFNGDYGPPLPVKPPSE